MSDKSKKCSECVRRGRKCENRLFSGSEWNKQRKDEAAVATKLVDADVDISHFQQEIDNAQRRLALMHRYLSQTLARHSQLRKHQQFLKDRGRQMLAHDSQISKRLDQESPPLDDQQLFSVSQMLDQLDPNFWNDPVLGGIFEFPLDSSSGSG